MSLFDPKIERYLIADQGEVVIDEVRKHWASTIFPRIGLFFGFVVMLLSFFVHTDLWWGPLLLGASLSAYCYWLILEKRVDRFVITNMRVFRVHGILSQSIATMPLSRILDISVHKPIVGRMLGYGHFIFESAAQEQGLREIRYVGDPDRRGLTIQRVIQQAGLRGFNAQQPYAASQSAGAQRTVPVAQDSTWDDGTASDDTSMIPPRPPLPPYDPDRTNTAPIDFHR
jgi:hypothetical protein